MPKTFYHSDVKLIKKPLKLRFRSILIFFGIGIILSASVVSGVYISRALTVGNIATVMVYGGSSIARGEKKYYAVMLGEYDSRDEATSVGLGASVQGASGYVWEDGNYWVVGSIYTSRSDAESVVDNLKDTNYTLSVKEIKLKKIKLSFDNLDNKDVKVIREGLALYDDVYEALYDYSIKFDSKVYNNLAVCSYISSLRGRVKTSISALQSIVGGDERILSIKGGLISIDAVLDQLILQTIQNLGTNYQLRYGMSLVVRTQYETYKKL